MKNHPQVGIGVLIFKGPRLLLGKRQRAHGAYSWGPPGGHLEFGESFEDCGRREVNEETGFILSGLHFIDLTNDIFLEENKHYVSVFLSATCPLGQSLQNREPEKIAAWDWFDPGALPERLFLPLQNLLEKRGPDFLRCLAA